MRKYYVKNISYFCLFLCLQEINNSKFQTLDRKYHLVAEAYHTAKTLFIQGRINYGQLKERSMSTMDMFLDLVEILNDSMSRELRSAIVKFYRIKFLHDFNNYVITMEEIMDIIDHCLIGPMQKLMFIRKQFHGMINNFEDVRHFETVDKCHNELPDEVSAAHCILHLAVLFNETMQENLVSLVEIKTKQHATDVNATLSQVQTCLNHFVPNFYDQLLVDTYSESCSRFRVAHIPNTLKILDIYGAVLKIESSFIFSIDYINLTSVINIVYRCSSSRHYNNSAYLKVLNASIKDFTSGKWRNNSENLFPKKWGPLVNNLKEMVKTDSLKDLQEPLYITLFAANISSVDIVKTLYS